MALRIQSYPSRTCFDQSVLDLLNSSWPKIISQCYFDTFGHFFEYFSTRSFLYEDTIPNGKTVLPRKSGTRLKKI